VERLAAVSASVEELEELAASSGSSTAAADAAALCWDAATEPTSAGLACSRSFL